MPRRPNIKLAGMPHHHFAMERQPRALLLCRGGLRANGGGVAFNFVRKSYFDPIDHQENRGFSRKVRSSLATLMFRSSAGAALTVCNHQPIRGWL